MNIDIAPKAKKQYETLPEPLQALAKKQFRYLLDNPRHPSLNVKKYKGSFPDVWQGRINKRVRFYFQIRGETFLILAITDHPK